MDHSQETKGTRKRARAESVKYFDWGLLAVTILLLVFGLLMLYSTSSYIGALEYGDPAYYLKRQLFAIVIGLIAMFLFSGVNYLIFERISRIFYIVSLLACLIVIFIGSSGGGSHRWLIIGGVSIQPSELCKVAVIVLIASLIYRNSDKLKDWKFIVKLFILVLPGFALVAYNNLSTAIIIFAISYVMLFVAGKQYWLFVLIAVAAVLVVVFYINFWGYRSERIEVWQNPESYEKGYQVMQGLYAIGSGGIFGKGLGASIQKQGFIPEAQNDMIFSIICEELGIIGAICLIVMFVLLIWRLMVIAINARDLFGSFTVIGIIVHISLQVILNISVVTNSIPNTGVTLPFISYGGTSISIMLAEIGLALGISRGITLR